MTPRSPFRCFKASPEVIRLAVMFYVRFPLSLREVEDPVHERGIVVSCKTVWFWRQRFGPMFASEVRWMQVGRKSFPRCRWHLDEVFVKVNAVQYRPWGTF